MKTLNILGVWCLATCVSQAGGDPPKEFTHEQKVRFATLTIRRMTSDLNFKRLTFEDGVVAAAKMSDAAQREYLAVRKELRDAQRLTEDARTTLEKLAIERKAIAGPVPAEMVDQLLAERLDGVAHFAKDRQAAKVYAAAEQSLKAARTAVAVANPCDPKLEQLLEQRDAAKKNRDQAAMEYDAARRALAQFHLDHFADVGEKWREKQKSAVAEREQAVQKTIVKLEKDVEKFKRNVESLTPQPLPPELVTLQKQIEEAEAAHKREREKLRELLAK